MANPRRTPSIGSSATVSTPCGSSWPINRELAEIKAVARCASFRNWRFAERLGRVVDAKHWLTVAAESGDTDAMLRLIEEHDHGDLARCWTWVYLSRLVGTDPSKGAYYAINEDGSEYDDDVGGPVYVVGRNGVDLDFLSAEQDAAARQAAQDLFEQIQQATAVEPRR